MAIPKTTNIDSNTVRFNNLFETIICGAVKHCGDDVTTTPMNACNHHHHTRRESIANIEHHHHNVERRGNENNLTTSTTKKKKATTRASRKKRTADGKPKLKSCLKTKGKSRKTLTELDTNNSHQRKQLEHQNNNETSSSSSRKKEKQQRIKKVRFQEVKEINFVDKPSKQETKDMWYRSSDFKDFRASNWISANEVRFSIGGQDGDNDYSLRGLEKYQKNKDASLSSAGSCNISSASSTKKVYIQNIMMLQMNAKIRSDPEKFAALASVHSRRDRLLAKRRASQDEKDAFLLYKESHNIIPLLLAIK